MTDKSVRGPFTSCAQDMWTSFNSSRLKGSFNLLLITFTWLVTTRAAMYASNMNRSIKWNNKVWWHTMSTRLLLLPRTWKATWIEFSPNTNTNGTIAYTRISGFPIEDAHTPTKQNIVIPDMMPWIKACGTKGRSTDHRSSRCIVSTRSSGAVAPSASIWQVFVALIPITTLTHKASCATGIPISSIPKNRLFHHQSLHLISLKSSVQQLAHWEHN